MKYWSFYLIYPLACFVGWLPSKAQFALSNVVRWMVYNVFKYRRAVVRENLNNAFPDYTPEKILQIEHNFYDHLADVFLETMMLSSISEKKMRQRMRFTNSEEFEQQTGGRSAIAVMAHYGSWEYSSSYGMHSSHEAVYGVYRPLADKGFDKYYIKVRSRFGSTPVSMKDITISVAKKRNSRQGVIVALIADQAPPRSESNKWFTFLNQPTQFFMGCEKMSTRMHLPVYFTYMDKKNRGDYEAHFEMIYDGDEQVDKYEVTRRYVERLEQMIIRRPELWMWSHRRWKRKPLNDE